MIAYKLFYVNGKDFMSATMSNSLFPYSKGYIWQRPDGWGPFACFACADDAIRFRIAFGWRDAELYTVRIKKSKDTSLWFYNKLVYRYENARPPNGTILADEFEILEQVK